MKKIFGGILCISLAGFLFGYQSITYARIIPGVDEPFDPTAYYSPTEILYADSAPSVFALRELEQGEVFDYTRLIKSVLFGDNFLQWYKELQKITKSEEDNMKTWNGVAPPSAAQSSLQAFDASQSAHANKNGNKGGASWSGSSSDEIALSMLDVMKQNRADNITTLDIAETEDFLMQKALVDGHEDMYYDPYSFNYEKRNQWLIRKISEISVASNNIANDQSAVLAASGYGQALSDEAIGAAQARIAGNFLSSVETQAWEDRGSLIDKIVQIYALKEYREMDEANRASSFGKGKMNFVVDPFDEEKIKSYEDFGYVRPEKKPMPDFK